VIRANNTTSALHQQQQTSAETGYMSWTALERQADY